MFKSRTGLTMLAALTLGVIALIVVLATRPIDRTGSQASDYEGSTLPAAVPTPNFILIDESGAKVTLDALKGSPSILTFLYTSCKDICPVTAQQIRGAMDKTGHDVPVLAITVDPKNDTPAAVKRWLTDQHLSGRIHWGLGSEARLQPVWRDYGVAPQTSRSDHSAYVFILDRNGKRCVSWPVSQLTPESLAHDLKLISSRDGNCSG